MPDFLVWKPQRPLAFILAVLGGSVSILMDLGNDSPMSGTIGKAAIVAAVGGTLGFVAGLLLRVIFREMKSSDVEEQVRIPEGIDGLKEIEAEMENAKGVKRADGQVETVASSVDTGEEKKQVEHDAVLGSDGGNPRKEREGVMASDSS